MLYEVITREKDAHAWVEIYLDGMWQRIEPTAFASTVSDTQLQDTQKTSDFNRYILFIKYQIETWILEYSALSQKRLFSYLKSDTLFLLEFVFVLLIIIGGILFTAYFLIQQRCKDKLLCPLAPLLKKLSKIGFPRYPNESLNTYFVRIEALTSLPLSRLNEIYHLLRYKSDSSKELFERFQQEISTILKKLN